MAEIVAERVGDTVIVSQDGKDIFTVSVDLARELGVMLFKAASFTSDALDDVEAAANG